MADGTRPTRSRSGSRTATAGGRRMSAEDWASRSIDVLVAEGIEAITINRLCREFGVTRGSFYWHFKDLDDLKEAMAAQWRTRTREALRELGTLQDLPPVQRLRTMTHHLISDETWVVER